MRKVNNLKTYCDKLLVLKKREKYREEILCRGTLIGDMYHVIKNGKEVLVPIEEFPTNYKKTDGTSYLYIKNHYLLKTEEDILYKDHKINAGEYLEITCDGDVIVVSKEKLKSYKKI